ncbi:MAG TPA: ATP-binding protein [Candidatus Eisenbacteria bacterium]|nr:ATP-binding protein [Candidatus Eisenbacteria bacterium]
MSPSTRSTPLGVVREPGRVDLDSIGPILAQIIDSLVDAILVIDRTQHVVAANRRYVEAFGTKGWPVAGSECSAGAACPERVSGETSEPCAACEVLREKKPAKRLRVAPDATGAQRRWEGTLSPIVGADGEVSHVVEVWRDISERSRLESQLGHSERLASLGVLAAGVAHEINNPLAGVVMGIESLERWLVPVAERGDARAGEALDVLAMLERESRRVREIVEKLMLLAQPYSVKAVWVDMNRAASDTADLLRYQTQAQEVEVSLDLDPSLPLVWAKETSMRSICMNLMMNAVQAMPDGGALTVRTGVPEPGRVRLEILDTGKGIAAEHLDRIWDPFFTTKPTGQGTGLGLSITNRIVHRHGGEIVAGNRPSGGARFVVELPVQGPGGTGDA